MVFRRKRRFTRKRTFRRKAPNVRAIVHSILDAQTESKYLDSTITHSPQSAISIQDVTPIVQGIAADQRIGEHVSPRWYQFNGILQFNISGLFHTVRIMVIQWREDSSLSSPSSSALLEHVTGVETVVSPLRIAPNLKFNVLYDRRFHVSSVDRKQQFIKINIPGTKDIEFNGSATTGRNHIFLCTWSDAAALLPTLDGFFRMMYKDC